jgi:hypothetical protein
MCPRDRIYPRPSHGFEWLKKFPESYEILDFTTATKAATKRLKELDDLFFADLLALRGFLAYEFFFHCLFERYRVTFGTSELSKKRIAIPFRAADVPSERAEFYHPDCALCFTFLSYYYSGLTREQFLRAMEILISLGANAKKSIYRSWVEKSKQRMSAEELRSLDTVEKIDLTNPRQFKSAFAVFRKNRETVNFWLESCILSNETKQYAGRLVATPWNLADNKNGEVYGFSGTNDTNLTMPLQVSELVPGKEAQSIVATNGRMVDMISRNPEYRTIRSSEGTPTWLAIVSEVLREKTNALIDAGALMAGITNEQVAKTLAKNLEGKSTSFFYRQLFKHLAQWI